MPVRPATRRDLSRITAVLAAAFYDESFHAKAFPFRKEYPDDYLRAWQHRVTELWWDYQQVFVVSYELDANGGEEVVGVAVWKRAGDGWRSLWGIKGRWDPRLFILPVLSAYHSLCRRLFPNRASIQPSPTDPRPLTYWTIDASLGPFVSQYFVPPTSTSTSTSTPSLLSSSLPPPPPPPSPPPSPPRSTPFYELVNLAVDPARQSQGHGRLLCAWGLGLARRQGLPAVVVAAEDKDRFYRRCGFEVLVGWATDGEGNPLRKLGVKGGAVLWMMPSGRDGSDGDGEGEV